MSITYNKLKELLTPDASEKIVVNASAFDTPAIVKLWDTIFYLTTGTLEIDQATMTADDPNQRVTITGVLASGVIEGINNGQVSTGVFALLGDGTVTAKLVINIADDGWKFSETFSSLDGSVLDLIALASPSLTIDSTAPDVLPADFRSNFGYPPDIKEIADSLVKGLSFSATLNVNGTLQELLSPVITFPLYVSGPVELWYFPGDEFNPTPSLYPEMLLNISNGGQTVTFGSNKFVFNLQTAIIFQEIVAKDQENFAILPTGVLALRCDFTPQGWQTIPVSMYIYDDSNTTLQLVVGERYQQPATKGQLNSLVNGADLTSILNPVSGFPIFEDLSLDFISVDLSANPFSFNSLVIAFSVVSQPWQLFNDLIEIDNLGFSIQVDNNGSSWSAAGNVYASAKFAPKSNADVVLSAYVGIPELYFEVKLDAQSDEMNLLAPVQQLVGDSIPLPTITGAEFAVTGNVSQSSYQFEANIKEHWALVGGDDGLVLTGMYLTLASSKAGVSGTVSGTFSLGGVGISVSANYSTTAGWVFIGETLPGQNPNLTDLISDLARLFGFTPPAGLPEIDLNQLYIEYSAKDKRMAVNAELSFSDLSINLTELPLVGKYLSPEDSIVLSSVLINIDTSAPSPATFTINLLLAGSTEKIVLSFGGSSVTPDLQEADLVHDRLLPAVNTPPGLNANSEAGTWINLQKTFGPINVQRIGFRLDNGLKVMLDASLSFTAFSASVMGLGVTVPLQSPYTPSFDIGGLGVSYSTPALTISGAFLKTETRDYMEFAGQLIVHAGNFGLSIIGSYATTTPPSLFAFLMVNAPIGGPPFFFVNGISGGFGYNRNLLIPPIDQVINFPLVAGASASGNPFGPDPSLADAMRVMDQYLGVAIGENWVAVGVNVSSFGMLNISALLSVAFGSRFQLALLGIGTLQVPALDPVPIVFAQLAMSALFIPGEGILAVYAQLTADSYVFTKDCHLTGGFAFNMWFEPTDPNFPPDKNHAGDFVITFGGYNPNFKPASYYPSVPLLGMNWKVSSELVIKGGLYFALTPHAVMAGGRLEASWESGPLSASFKVHADFLIYWKPFHYDISMGVSFSVRASVDVGFVRVSISASISAELHIWGPPFKYRARIDLDIISFTIGNGEDDSKPKAIDWTDFRDSFLDQSSQSESKSGGSSSFMDRPVAQKDWRTGLNRRLASAAEIDQPCSQAVYDVSDKSPVVTVVATSGVIQDLTRDGQVIAVHPDPDDPGKIIEVPIDYVVDPQHFSVQTQSLAASKSVSYNNDALSGGWNTDFGISPMQISKDDLKSTHTVTVCRLTDSMFFDGFEPTPFVAKVSKAMWLYQENLDKSLNGAPLLDDVLQGLVLRPKVVNPAHSVPIKVKVLEYDPEGVVDVNWGTDPAPTKDPFGGLDPNATLASTIGNEAVYLNRSDILADLYYNGFAMGTALNTRPMQDLSRLELLSPVTLSYLGEPKTIGSTNQ